LASHQSAKSATCMFAKAPLERPQVCARSACLAGSLPALLAPSIVGKLTNTIDELLGRTETASVDPRRSTVNVKTFF
jgi:hypothetical protein